MSAAHVNWVRQVFPWDRIEPEQGIYDWETWDRIVDTVGQREDIRIIAVLMFTPSWTRTTLSPDQRTAPPSDPVQFGNFAAAFAERYGKSIDYYQIWDEPNLTEAWGKLEPRAVDYLAMLREAYTAIHAADRYATVISGALAPT